MQAEEAQRQQIALYRQMTGERRLGIALNLHELACELAREGIRKQHPQADSFEVERLLLVRLRHALVP